MIAYASRTGTRKNLKALKEAGWRLLVNATGEHRNEGFAYALDNGAWTAHQRGEDFFDPDAFLLVLHRLAPRADFIVAPDIVQGGLESLEFSDLWLPMTRQFARGRVLLAVQDGMEPRHVEPKLRRLYDGLFVGGSSEFKEQTMHHWTELAHRMGRYVHVGRVNTRRRIRLCHDCGVDSFDGTSATIFLKTLPMLESERRQPSLFDGWSD